MASGGLPFVFVVVGSPKHGTTHDLQVGRQTSVFGIGMIFVRAFRREVREGGA